MSGDVMETGTRTEDRHVRDAPAIPGLRFRRYAGLEDVPGIVEAERAANLVDKFDYIPTVAELTNELAHQDGFDAPVDILLAEVDGRIVAHGRVKQVLRDEEVTYELQGEVHPEFRRRGIGRTILLASERRARERAHALTGPGEIRLATWAPDTSLGHAALMRVERYEPVRYFFEMVKKDLDALPSRSLPVGLEIRPVERATLRQIFDAENEAFRDHWGHKDRGDTQFDQMASGPDLDVDLWRVAWAGDEVAGVVTTYIFAEENAALGYNRAWLERISVRRPWRGRGVATALILSACAGLRDHGIAEAALGVDAENPTGALGLYRSLGFEKVSQATSWRKALADGASD